MTTKIEILKLYKALIKESKKIPTYNFREYAIRKVHDSFKQNKNLKDADSIAAEIKEAQSSLELIKRQAIIGQLYSTEKIVIENILK